MSYAKSNVHSLASTPAPQSRPQEGEVDTRRWPNSLRILRRARSLTLEQLAEISDVSVSYLSRLEAGLRRLNADTIDKLTHALGCEAAELMQAPPMITGKFSPTGGVPLSHASQAHGGGSTRGSASNRDLPVYGKTSFFGPDLSATEAKNQIDFKKPIEWIQRPTELSGVDAAFALYINDKAMYPKFSQGDIVVTHPYRPPTEGSYVVVVKHESEVMVRQFVAWTPTEVVLKQFTCVNGAYQEVVSNENISALKGIYRIITTMENH